MDTLRFEKVVSLRVFFIIIILPTVMSVWRPTLKNWVHGLMVWWCLGAAQLRHIGTGTVCVCAGVCSRVRSSAPARHCLFIVRESARCGAEFGLGGKCGENFKRKYHGAWRSRYFDSQSPRTGRRCPLIIFNENRLPINTGSGSGQNTKNTNNNR